MARTCFAGLLVAILIANRTLAGSPVESSPQVVGVGSGAGLEELNQQLQRDLADGELHEFSLFQAALVAGGVKSRDELQRRTKQFDERCQPLANEIQPLDNPRSQQRLLTQRFHEIFLPGEYRADCSELHRTLDLGHYNCVSATILFHVVANRCGLTPIALASQAHLFSSLPGEPPLYVETTCPEWNPAPLHACPSKTQARVRDSRKLSTVQLLGKVYYNRGVAELESQRFAVASETLTMAWRLDAWDKSARENLLATLNNWALAECGAGRYRRAAELVVRGLAIDSRYGPLLANDLHIHQKWVTQLCDAEDFAAAVEILDSGYRRRPDAELFQRGRLATLELWAGHHFAQGELDRGWHVLDEARRRCWPNTDPLREIAVVQDACGKLLARQQRSIATRLLEEALRHHPAAANQFQSYRELLQPGL